MKNTATKGKTDKIDFIKIKHLYALKVKVKSLSRVRLFATPWGVAHQVSPSMGFSRQEYWSGLPFPSPGESSQSRDQTRVSRIAGRCCAIWATREVLTQREVSFYIKVSSADLILPSSQMDLYNSFPSPLPSPNLPLCLPTICNLLGAWPLST